MSDEDYGLSDLFNTAAGNIDGNYEYVTTVPQTWESLEASVTPAQTVSVSSNQESGSGFLDAFTGAVGSVANIANSLTKAYTTVENASLAQTQAELQAQVAKNATVVAGKQADAAATIATLQTATQVAQAQKAYATAAGAGTLDLKTMIALAGVVLLGFKVIGGKS